MCKGENILSILFGSFTSILLSYTLNRKINTYGIYLARCESIDSTKMQHFTLCIDLDLKHKTEMYLSDLLLWNTMAI